MGLGCNAGGAGSTSGTGATGGTTSTTGSSGTSSGGGSATLSPQIFAPASVHTDENGPEIVIASAPIQCTAFLTPDGGPWVGTAILIDLNSTSGYAPGTYPFGYNAWPDGGSFLVGFGMTIHTADGGTPPQQYAWQGGSLTLTRTSPGFAGSFSTALSEITNYEDGGRKVTDAGTFAVTFDAPPCSE